MKNKKKRKIIIQLFEAMDLTPNPSVMFVFSLNPFDADQTVRFNYN